MMVVEALRKQIEIACEQRDAAWAAIGHLRRELMLAREWREAFEEVARRHREAEDECERLRGLLAAAHCRRDFSFWLGREGDPDGS